MESISDVLGPAFNTGENQVQAPRNELGQDDFIRLMVAQLKNQDPTNPLDNAEFLGQMAQFSMVEGIDDLGASFEGVSSNLYASQAMMAAQLIEREVLVDAGPAYTAYFTPGDRHAGSFEASDTASDVRVNIYDGSGVLVNSMNLGTVESGSHQFSWGGERRNGGAPTPGNYVFTAEGNIDGKLTSLPMQQYSEVTSVSVDRESGAISLHLLTGATINFSQVNEFK